MHQHRPLLALAIRTCGAFAFATMSMLVKLASESGAALPEIMFWRQAVSAPLILLVLAATGQVGLLRTRHIGSHARRALVGMTGMIVTFGAIILLPLAEATTLSFTAPLFAVLAAALVFREHVGPWRWSAVAIGFAGVVVTAQPGLAPIPLGGLACALAAAMILVVVNYLIRDMGKTEHPVAITFYFGLIGAIMVAGALPFYASEHTPMEWLYLIGLGLAGTVGQLMMTMSLRYGSVASVIIMDYTSLIWATGWGWLVWDHMPTLATLMGAPLIVLAGLLIAWREHRLSREPGLPTSLDVD